MTTFNRRYGLIISVLCFLLLQSCSTSKENHSKAQGISKKAKISQIIQALKSRHANYTYIALQTLKANGIETPKINIEGEFSIAKPKLQKLIKRIETLSKKKLNTLDQSLKYYTSINSPFYSDRQKGWK